MELSFQIKSNFIITDEMKEEIKKQLFTNVTIKKIKKNKKINKKRRK